MPIIYWQNVLLSKMKPDVWCKNLMSVDLSFLASRAVLDTLNTQLSCILNPQVGKIMTVWTWSISIFIVILINQRHFWNRNPKFKHSAKCGTMSFPRWEQCQSFLNTFIETPSLHFSSWHSLDMAVEWLQGGNGERGFKPLQVPVLSQKFEDQI